MAEKKQRDRLIRLADTHPQWALGVADEVWWSRLAHPQLHSWAAVGQELRLVQKATALRDPDPKALGGSGLLLRATTITPEKVWLRFTRGPPVSGITIQFLAWCCAQVAALNKQALLLVWDNASWHRSQEVRRWLRAHNQSVKQTRRGIRIVSCRLPTQSPWLNPIEPKWVHGKRAVLEPERVLTAAELEARVYAYYGCQPEPPLVITQKVA
jgi:transposase